MGTEELRAPRQRAGESFRPDTGVDAPRLLLVCADEERLTLLAGAVADAWPGGDPPLIADGLDATRRVLTEARVDAIVLDLHLEGAQGLEGVALLGAAAPVVPLVVLSSPGDDHLVAAALAEGAQEALAVSELEPSTLWLAIQLATQRKAAAVRARRERDAGAAILDTIDSAAVAIDGTGRITACNEAWVRAAVEAGADPVSVGVGVNYLEVCDRASGLMAEGAAAVADGIRAVLHGREGQYVSDYQCPNRSRDRWFTVRVRPLGRVGGGAVISHSDITELHLAEEALRYDDVTLAGLFGQAADIFALLDASGTLVHLSDHTLRYLGIDGGRLPTGSFGTIHPSDVGLAEATLAAALATPGERHQLRVRARTGEDGPWRVLDAVLTNLLDHPAVRAITVVGTDVTDRARARVVAGLESRLLHRLPAAVIVTDDAGIVVYWNRRAEQLYGWTSAEVMGRSVEELTVFTDDRSGEILAEVADLGRWEGEFEARTRNGVALPIFVTLEAVSDAETGFEGIVGASVDDTERRRLREVLAHQALHDSLTGLPNRALFLDRLDQALARQRRSERTVAVLFVDLDRFKLVNDTHGHHVGDEVLRAVSTRFEDVLRPGDTVARLGGDEFAVCCEGIDGAAESVALAERLAGALAAPVQVGLGEFYVTPSIGIALARPQPGRSADSLLREADMAMYHAKNEGRNRWELFDQSMRRDSLRRGQLGADLRTAVQRHELELEYQPVVSLPDGGLVGFEALLRWNHPDRGRLNPEDFIDLAEETNLIVPIGAWVITEAARQLASWRDAHPDRDLTLAVNLSGRQIASPGLARLVRAALDAHDLEPASLCFEITESVLMSDAAASVAVLRELRSVGVQLAIDDFGTGYSSLAYLKRFPVDYLKVDRSFVAGIGREAEDTVIVLAVVDLAASLGLRCVAEGVERPDQLALLTDAECSLAQGFLWSRPVLAAEAGEMIEQWASEPRPAVQRSAHPSLVAAASTSSLVSVLTHELATPLSMITGQCEVVEPLAMEHPRVAAAVATIARNARRIEEVLVSMTSAQDLDDGALPLRPGQFVLAETIAAAVEVVGPQGAGRVELDLEPNLAVTADERRIEEALGHLLRNAVRYGDGPIKVTSRSTGEEILVTVADDGPGIPADRVADAFRRFSRLQPGRAGLGLGLYLARGIARAHGGDVVYETSPAGGAQLVLTLPAR